MFHIPRPSKLLALLRSRIRPLDIRQDDIQEVLLSFGLSMTGRPANLALSRRTENIVVSTNVGKMVIKRYRNHLLDDGILYIHSIISRLAELSFPTLKLIHTSSGANFISLESGRYAIFDFINGSNYSLDIILPADRQRLTQESGRILASFHQSLNGFQPLGSHHLGFVSYTGGWRRDIEWFVYKARELIERSSIISTPDDKIKSGFLASRVDNILEELSRLDAKLNKMPLMRTIIHGDFGLHNLIFQKNGRMILTDYETARLEWRLADLVTTLSRNRSQNAMYHFELIKNFLMGYLSVAPIPEEEWRCLPDVWMFLKLRSVFISWNSFFERGGNLLPALDAYNQVKWVRDNAHTLVELGAL